MNDFLLKLFNNDEWRKRQMESIPHGLDDTQPLRYEDNIRNQRPTLNNYSNQTDLNDYQSLMDLYGLRIYGLGQGWQDNPGRLNHLQQMWQINQMQDARKKKIAELLQFM